MTTEAMVTTPEVTEIQSGETAVNPEIAGQETTSETQVPEGEGKPELTPAEREAKALKRRVDRLTREKYQLTAQIQNSQHPAHEPGEQETLTAEDVERRANKRADEIAETRRVNDRCNEVAKLGEKAFKGEFEKAMTEVHATLQLFDAKQQPTLLMQAILDTDEPHKMLHYLGNNTEIADEIADMSPLRAARKLGQIERDMATKPEPKRSNAPPPLQPVKAGATGSAPDPSKDPEGWMKWRNEQTRAQRK